jgi:hypothetical protein
VILPGTPTGSRPTLSLPWRNHAEVPMVVMRHASTGQVAPPWEGTLPRCRTRPHPSRGWGRVSRGTLSVRLTTFNDCEHCHRPTLLHCKSHRIGCRHVVPHSARPTSAPGDKGFFPLVISHLPPRRALPMTRPLLDAVPMFRHGWYDVLVTHIPRHDGG